MKAFYKTSFLILMIVASITLNAQKNVNVDNYRFNYKERDMPLHPLEPRSFYYATKITMPGSIRNLIDEEQLYDNLKIQGQRLTEEPKEDDLLVTVVMGNFNIKSSDVVTRVVENKDKDGKVTSKNYYYSVVVAYTFDSEMIGTKGEKEVIRRRIYSLNSNMSYKTNEFNSSKAASDYWNNNRENLKENLIKELVSNSISESSKALTLNFGFPVNQKSNLIKTINEKKHPENLDLRAKADALKNRLEALDGTIPMTEEEISDIIEYFKGIPTRYTDPKLKADVRLRYVAYYNLCKIYLFLDQPEKVREYADAITANGHDKKDGERMNKEAIKLIQRFRNSDIKTRQFDPESFFVD